MHANEAHVDSALFDVNNHAARSVAAIFDHGTTFWHIDKPGIPIDTSFWYLLWQVRRLPNQPC
jgi:hypothetical protein